MMVEPATCPHGPAAVGSPDDVRNLAQYVLSLSKSRTILVKASNWGKAVHRLCGLPRTGRFRA